MPPAPSLRVVQTGGTWVYEKVGPPVGLKSRVDVCDPNSFDLKLGGSLCYTLSSCIHLAVNLVNECRWGGLQSHLGHKPIQNIDILLFTNS